MSSKKKSGSDVWEAFTKHTEMKYDKGRGFSVSEKTAKCKFCKFTKVIIRGNTSALWSHLEHGHFAEYCKYKNPAQKSVNKSKSASQPTITMSIAAATPYDPKSKEYQERTNAIIEYITADGRPLCTVESEKFIKMLRVFDNRYKVPDRRTLTESKIPAKYMEVRTGIHRLLERNKNSCIPIFSLTTDLWSSSTMEPYISLTAHFITDSFEMKRVTLETKYMPDKHTGVNISQAVIEMLNDWDLERRHISAITTDSAANMLKFAEECNLERIPCFGHLLHNGVSKALAKEEVAPVITKAKRISAYFHQSHQKTKLLHETQKAAHKTEKVPHGSCPTRWGSTYELLNDVNNSIDEIKKVVVTDRQSLVTTPDEDTVLKRVVEAFKSLNDMTDGLSAEKSVTGSGFLPMLRLVRSFCWEAMKDQRGREYRNSVFDYMKNKYARVENVRVVLLILFQMFSVI